ncbi:hypothetical protein [Methylobacterium frigidaeris]|uniref:hypothetical protein n=1 Tax=Methylobacterium frigidaeris TaxID=2038277 RepID=UPI001EDDC9D1|nr:hypothetical protein [Methylobacterium frigidaeris]
MEQRPFCAYVLNPKRVQALSKDMILSHNLQIDLDEFLHKWRIQKEDREFHSFPPSESARQLESSISAASNLQKCLYTYIFNDSAKIYYEQDLPFVLRIYEDLSELEAKLKVMLENLRSTPSKAGRKATQRELFTAHIRDILERHGISLLGKQNNTGSLIRRNRLLINLFECIDEEVDKRIASRLIAKVYAEIDQKKFLPRN